MGVPPGQYLAVASCRLTCSAEAVQACVAPRARMARCPNPIMLHDGVYGVSSTNR